ncbi:MAG TPA: tRNA (guanosine(37)-N1)-methyltransferase TrmD [Steroidobacteraceae bacterium]|nr:tRNA (guanosine(37)-N1)-methyltransferase TrmD [Steroidobacteraceae bacterium]
MKIEVVTLFPRMIAGALEFGVIGRAIARRLLSVGTEDPRGHTSDVHRTVDDRPYGGGPGMVMKAEPLLGAIRTAHARLPQGSPRVYLSAQGEPFGQTRAQELARLPGLLLIAGRYEGVDERVIELGADRELSVGDYVLSGGELPALTVIDAVARLLPGVLGDERSSLEESFVGGLLDWPHYTRPEIFEGRAVPAVLLSGDHADIRRWRLEQALARTLARRPELLRRSQLSREAQSTLEEIQGRGGARAGAAAAVAAGSDDRGERK